jgi:hypothetical protein
VTRPLETILREEEIRFTERAVRSATLTLKPSDDWVLHQRIVGANSYAAGLAPVDRLLISLPIAAAALTALGIASGWDIALPLGVVATILAGWLAIRSFQRLLDLRRHEHAMKCPLYALDIERGSQYCEFFTSRDPEEVRLVRDALEDFLTDEELSHSGKRRTA